ncbi:hypothetical protein Bca4012_065621 [Brassica carinata]
MDFWEGIMGEDLVLAEGIEPDRAAVCGETEEDVGRTTATLSLAGQGGGTAALDDNKASCQGSCENIALAVSPSEPLAIETQATSNNNTLIVPKSGNEILEAFKKFLVIRGEGPKQFFAQLGVGS